MTCLDAELSRVLKNKGCSDHQIMIVTNHISNVCMLTDSLACHFMISLIIISSGPARPAAKADL